LFSGSQYADLPIDFSGEHAWSPLSAQFQERIIENVWCGQCHDAVRIVKFTVFNKPGGIVLDGLFQWFKTPTRQMAAEPSIRLPHDE